jgi:hypothetical protein
MYGTDKGRQRFVRGIFAIGVLSSFLLSGCGNSPLGSLGDASSIPSNLSLPVALVNGSFSGVGSSELQSASAWRFNSVTTTPVAPAAGLVVEISGTSLTVLHSARLASRFTGIQGVAFRAGDYVDAGRQLSTNTFVNSTFTYSVLLDGVAVCPLSYLSASARSGVASLGGFSAATVCSQN